MWGSHSTNRGVRPFQATAWADAENVKLGSTTGPGRPSTSAWTTSIRPEVHELTATTWSTRSRSAIRSSSSRTRAPLVSCPLSYDRATRRRTRSSGGRAGRANGRPGPSGLAPDSRASWDGTDRLRAPFGRTVSARSTVGTARVGRPGGRSSAPDRPWPARPRGDSRRRTDPTCRSTPDAPVVVVTAAPLELVHGAHQALPVEGELGPQDGDRRVVRRLDAPLPRRTAARGAVRPGADAGDLDRDVVVGAQARRGGSSGGPGRGSRPARPCRAGRSGRSSAMAPACSTRLTASGMVMKYRVMSSLVTVTGPPSRIWRRNVGTTLPRLPSTLPNRTAA